MVKIPESLEPKAGEMESIIQEYKLKIAQALEIERNKLKERAETDSSQIIARAREAADRSLAQARQEAQAEADRIIARAREKAEQIARESREKYSAEARQESARVVSETAQIINEAIQRSMTQVKSEFDRAGAKARSRLEREMSRLLTEVNKSVEQTIDEAGRNIQAGFEHLAAAITEVEKKLPLVAGIPERQTVMSSPPITEAARETENTGEREEPETEGTAKLEIESESIEKPETLATEHTEKLEKPQTEPAAGEETNVKAAEVIKTGAPNEADIRLGEGIVLSRLGK
jgi:hypothetical protein